MPGANFCGRRLFGILLALLLLPCAGQAHQDSLHVVSEAWEDHSNPDGSGSAWDLLRLVYEPEGILVRHEIMPYTRSLGLVQMGKADAVIGVYPGEVEGVIYPRWNYDMDEVFALGLASSPRPDVATLGQFRLVWMRGYSYQKYLPALRYQEVLRRDNVLDILENGRADFFIDALTEIDQLLGTSTDMQRYRVTHLQNLPLFVVFAPTPRGREMAEIFDQRMQKLATGPELPELFERWALPYPFKQVDGADVRL
jgi:ABC-type amino acid transport substrate-binding protein